MCRTLECCLVFCRFFSIVAVWTGGRVSSFDQCDVDSLIVLYKCLATLYLLIYSFTYFFMSSGVAKGGKGAQALNLPDKT